jgi:hypothetical protein
VSIEFHSTQLNENYQQTITRSLPLRVSSAILFYLKRANLLSASKGELCRPIKILSSKKCLVFIFTAQFNFNGEAKRTVSNELHDISQLCMSCTCYSSSEM